MGWAFPPPKWKRGDVLLRGFVDEKNDPNVHSITVFRGRHFNGAKEITAVGNALEKNAFIKEFYSSGHEVDEESAKILGKSFLKMKSLESICVGDERFGDESDDAFAVFVSYAKELDGLRRWDLENKGLTKRSFGKVSDAFESGKFKRLEELILNRNGSLSDGIAVKTIPRLLRNSYGSLSMEHTKQSQDAGNVGDVFRRGERICTRGGVER